MARNLRFNHTVEHRFVFAEGEEPQCVNGDAFPVTDAVDVPDTDLKAQVWRIQRGAEVSAHEREADKLAKLRDPDGTPITVEGDGELAELPALVAPDPTDPADRTPREEAERAARDAGHTLEGAIEDHDRHREFARRAGIEPGGPTAAAARPGGAGGPTPGRSTQPPASASGASAQPLPPGGAGPSRIQPASPAQPVRAATGTGQGPNAPAPALGQRTNVDIRGTMTETPPAPGQPQPTPQPAGSNR